MKKGNNASSITAAQRREIINLASRVAIEQYREEADRKRQELRDNKFHNTRLLMEKYRGFVIHSKSAVYNAAHIEDDYDLEMLLDLMGGRDFQVTSVQESAATTRMLVHHIDRMLDYFKYRCEQSPKPEDARRYRVIKGLYIDDEEKTPQELAEIEAVDISTIYKDVKAALLQLSALIFGYFE